MNSQRTDSQHLRYDARDLSALSVSLETCLKFRERFVIDTKLITDVWDKYSEHIGFFYKEDLIATVRIVYPYEYRLPLTEHAPEFPVQNEDLQVGRLVADQAYANRASILFCYKYLCDTVFPLGRRVYVAAVQNGPISYRRYCNLGFADTGCKYYDFRYGKSLQILVRLNPDVTNIGSAE